MYSVLFQTPSRINLSNRAVIKVMVETIRINCPNFPTFPSESLAIKPVINPTTAKIINRIAVRVEPEIMLRTTRAGRPTSTISPTVRQPLAWIKSKNTMKNLNRK